jgi:hypothetical protein
MTMGFYDHPETDPTANNRRIDAEIAASEIREVADFLADPAVELRIEGDRECGQLVAHRRIGG